MIYCLQGWREGPNWGDIERTERKNQSSHPEFGGIQMRSSILEAVIFSQELWRESDGMDMKLWKTSP